MRKTRFLQQAVKTVAFHRASTPQQNVRSPHLAVLEYARKHDFRVDDFIEATTSGRASETRRRRDAHSCSDNGGIDEETRT